MKITYYGQSCFGIEISGKNLVTDPFITGNELAKSIDIDAIKADYILVSHGHQDHTHDLERLAKNTDATVISAWEVHAWITQKGIKNAHPMNTGGKWKFDFGTVMCVTAQHSSSFPDGSYAGNPLGFVVWNEKEAFYFAGDTALTFDMKLIPMLCPKLTCAILPIGDNFTMDVKQAVIASDFVECNQIIGCHYDTFGFMKIDHEASKNEFTAKGKNLHLIEIGNTIEL
jgi:L-ascorbate metabolism protein UlaG (beta-lactamase superfamily)